MKSVGVSAQLGPEVGIAMLDRLTLVEERALASFCCMDTVSP